MYPFGKFITQRRKELGLTQKTLAARIKQDDGKPLSEQYLNDIEHGRRGAPPDYLLKQLAKPLRFELDLLYFSGGTLAARYPEPRGVGCACGRCFPGVPPDSAPTIKRSLKIFSLR
jgi:transcriptional regulator with XRE-family HTH domain